MAGHNTNEQSVSTTVADHHFPAMGGEVHLVLVGPQDGAAEWAQRRIRELESRWNRFEPTSEIAKLNNMAGRSMPVSTDTLTLVESMQLGSTATNGRFDPTLRVDVPETEHTVHDIVVSRSEGTVWKPTDLKLDPGPVATALVADQVVTQLVGDGGAAGVRLAIGSNVAAAGDPGRYRGSTQWRVRVDDPFLRFEELLQLGFAAGGAATCSPAAEQPSCEPETDLSAVTAVASAGWMAEVLASTALRAGSHGVIAFLEERGATGVAITNTGGVLCTSDLRVRPAWLESAI